MEIEEALNLIDRHARHIPDVLEISSEEAFGFVCGEDVTALVPVPAFPKSAMDGYAVNSKDVIKADGEHPVCLKVIGRIHAGDAPAIRYKEGTAVRIMTGAMVPEGYDAVVMQERTDYGEELVSVYAPVKPFENYCKVGEELKTGETVIQKGTWIGRTQTGLLAALGLDRVKIIRPARIAILSTGSELVMPGITLKPGMIYNSILPMLKACIREAKLDVVFSGQCSDEKEEIEAKLKEAVSKADLVITTGGVSVGTKDLMPLALRELGAEILFSRVNIQPGTPTMMSILDNKLILSLSGNPYAALVNFDLYFWNAISAMTGCDHFQSVKETAVLKDPYEKVNRARRLVRARVEQGEVTLPAPVHASSVFGNLEQCNCYLDVPAQTKIAPGDVVKIWKIRQ